MVDIDYILYLINWNNTKENQAKGIELAKKVSCIRVFIQPNDTVYNKNVWTNCAIILSNKTDEELEPYLYALFGWLQDMNWPGATEIFNRLQKFKHSSVFLNEYRLALSHARILKDQVWWKNLHLIKCRNFYRK